MPGKYILTLPLALPWGKSRAPKADDVQDAPPQLPLLLPGPISPWHLQVPPKCSGDHSHRTGCDVLGAGTSSTRRGDGFRCLLHPCCGCASPIPSAPAAALRRRCCLNYLTGLFNKLIKWGHTFAYCKTSAKPFFLFLPASQHLPRLISPSEQSPCFARYLCLISSQRLLVFGKAAGRQVCSLSPSIL